MGDIIVPHRLHLPLSGSTSNVLPRHAFNIYRSDSEMNMLEFFKQDFSFVFALTTYCAKLCSLLQFKISTGPFKNCILYIMIGNTHALADHLDLFLLNLVLLTVAGIVVIYGRTQRLITKY